MINENKSIKNNRILYSMFIVIILLFDVCFFDIPQIADYFYIVNNYHNKLALCLIVLVSTFYLISTRKIQIYKLNGYVKFILYYLFIVVVTFIGSLLVYNQTIIEVLKNYYYYVVLLLFFVLRQLINNEKYYDCLINLIITIGVIYSLILIFAKLHYTRTGNMLLSQVLLVVTHRNDTLRLMNISEIIPIASILSAAFALKKIKYRKRYIILCIICFVEIIYVSQTRMVELAILLSILLMLYLTSTKRKKILLLIVILFILIILYSPIMNFVNSFSLTGDIAYSTSIRIEAYRYFLKNCFNNFVFGVGFINSDKYNFIKFGPTGKYILSDLGYIGVIGVFGILGMLLIIGLFFLLLKQIKRLLIANMETYYPEVIIIISYLLISCCSLIFNDIQRVLYLPICFAILDYVDFEIKKRKLINVKDK